MDDRLDDRIDAIERAIADGHAADGLPETARLERRLDDLEATVDDVDDRLAELEAAVQALRGFAGGVRAVDEEVERRANAAVARVERLEAELDGADGRGRRGGGQSDAERGVVDDGREGHDAVGRPDGTGPTDTTLAEAAADAAAAVETPDPETAGAEDGAGSLADRVRRLL